MRLTIEIFEYTGNSNLPQLPSDISPALSMTRLKLHGYSYLQFAKIFRISFEIKKKYIFFSNVKKLRYFLETFI